MISSIVEQARMTPELAAALAAAATRTELEDLYLPYRPKRRTRATVAREHGLEPLAEMMWRQQPIVDDPSALARRFVDPSPEVPDLAAAFAGARGICAGRGGGDAGRRGCG